MTVDVANAFLQGETVPTDTENVRDPERVFNLLSTLLSRMSILDRYARTLAEINLSSARIEQGIKEHSLGIALEGRSNQREVKDLIRDTNRNVLALNSTTVTLRDTFSRMTSLLKHIAECNKTWRKETDDTLEQHTDLLTGIYNEVLIVLARIERALGTSGAKPPGLVAVPAPLVSVNDKKDVEKLHRLLRQKEFPELLRCLGARNELVEHAADLMYDDTTDEGTKWPVGEVKQTRLKAVNTSLPLDLSKRESPPCTRAARQCPHGMKCVFLHTAAGCRNVHMSYEYSYAMQRRKLAIQRGITDRNEICKIKIDEYERIVSDPAVPSTISRDDIRVPLSWYGEPSSSSQCKNTGKKTKKSKKNRQVQRGVSREYGCPDRLSTEARARRSARASARIGAAVSDGRHALLRASDQQNVPMPTCAPTRARSSSRSSGSTVMQLRVQRNRGRSRSQSPCGNVSPGAVNDDTPREPEGENRL